ncbi:hypothetical protein HED60_05595 [Planctomycetales bacterium ZRK34]|nr:hypothetical protein HED60_05595 [Planctomycetales bacterium ZRK34]
MADENTDIEIDPRFPSGRWFGEFIQFQRRFRMDLSLSFADGVMTGTGSDIVGRFTVRGAYVVETGKVSMLKSYAWHDVDYVGVAEEGIGIYGGWIIRPPWPLRGGFRLWPFGDDAEANRHARAENEIPAAVKGIGGLIGISSED